MRVYISGKMTGCPDLNRQAFDAAEKRLSARGHFVINPHRISALFGTAEELGYSFHIFYGIEHRTGDYVLREEFEKQASLARAVMDADLAAVRSCDAIYLLRGWESSRGARKELAEALKHGLRIMQADEYEREQEHQDLASKIRCGRMIKEQSHQNAEVREYGYRIEYALEKKRKYKKGVAQ